MRRASAAWSSRASATRSSCSRAPLSGSSRRRSPRRYPSFRTESKPAHRREPRMTLRTVPLILSAVALFASAASGQTLTLARAKQIAATAAADAKRLAAPGGAIAIADAGGHLLYLERLDGTFPAAAAVSTEKARTAAIFQKPTSDFEDAIKAGRTALLRVSVMTPRQGGVPIRIRGAAVRAIRVSGAASAQPGDDKAN